MWGEFHDSPYLVALAENPDFVPENEQRAMELMQSLCDPERFGIYIQTGCIHARGNLTGKIYRIEHGKGHGAGCWELEDGKPQFYWCTTKSAETWKADIPDTDHVLTLKNMIEGEEARFRTIANRSSADYHRMDTFEDEGSYRNFAAVMKQSPYEISIAKESSALEKKHDLGVMIYRDPFFDEIKKDGDSGFEDNVDMLTVGAESMFRLHPQLKRWRNNAGPHDIQILDEIRPGDLDLVRVCRTNDLWPYEGEPPGYPGPRATDAYACERFNKAQRLHHMTMAFDDRVEHMVRNEAADLGPDNGTCYLQGFIDGMATARPRRREREWAGLERLDINPADAEGYVPGFLEADDMQAHMEPRDAAIFRDAYMRGLEARNQQNNQLNYGFGNYYPLAINGPIDCGYNARTLTVTNSAYYTIKPLKAEIGEISDSPGRRCERLEDFFAIACEYDAMAGIDDAAELKEIPNEDLTAAKWDNDKVCGVDLNLPDVGIMKYFEEVA